MERGTGFSCSSHKACQPPRTWPLSVGAEAPASPPQVVAMGLEVPRVAVRTPVRGGAGPEERGGGKRGRAERGEGKGGLMVEDTCTHVHIPVINRPWTVLLRSWCRTTGVR